MCKLFTSQFFFLFEGTKLIQWEKKMNRKMTSYTQLFFWVIHIVTKTTCGCYFKYYWCQTSVAAYYDHLLVSTCSFGVGGIGMVYFVFSSNLKPILWTAITLYIDVLLTQVTEGCVPNEISNDQLSHSGSLSLSRTSHVKMPKTCPFRIISIYC